MLRALPFTTLAAILVLAGCGGSEESATSPAPRSQRADGREPAARATSKRDGGGSRAAPASNGARSSAERNGSGSSRDSARSSRARSAPATRREILLVQDLVEAFVRGLNDSDPSVCTRLFTQHRLEVITGRTGAAAVAKCRRDIAASDTKITLTRIEGVRVSKSGDRALATQVKFLSRVGGDEVRQLFALARAGGGYRIDAALRVEQPG